MWQIESTYKARDVEETIDLYFYRPVGYAIARVSQFLNLSPTGVTIISILVGMFAGHLFYYTDIQTNVIGMILLVIAEAMDSADGQLARMTKTFSRAGRFLDGFGGNLMFVSIYFHICLRTVHGGGSPWIFAVALLSGLSHSFQCAMADYYRNAYLRFVHGEKRNELEKSTTVEQLYQNLRWSEHPVRKFFLRTYLNYTYQQEALARNFQRLIAKSESAYGDTVPDWLRKEYAKRNKPLLKYYNFITTNTRMIALFVSLLVGNVYLYLAFELIVLNGVLLGARTYQDRVDLNLLRMIENQEGNA